MEESKISGTAVAWGIGIIWVIMVTAVYKCGSWEPIFRFIGYGVAALFIGAAILFLVVIPYVFFVIFLFKKQKSRSEWFESVDQGINDAVSQGVRVTRELDRIGDQVIKLDKSVMELNQGVKALKAFDEGRTKLNVSDVAKRIAGSS